MNSPKQKVNFGPNFSVPLALPIEKKINYGVRILYFNEDVSKPEKRVDFEVYTQFNRVLDKPELKLRFSRENLTLNRTEPDFIAEKLNHFVWKTLNPNEHTINRNGEIMDSFTNHYQILKNWDKSKEEINKKYKSEIVDKFIESNEKVFQNKNRLESAFEHDIFWCHFFHPRNLDYSASLKIESKFHFPLMPYKSNTIFLGTQSIDEYLTNYSTVLVQFISDQPLNTSVKKMYKLGDGEFRMSLDASFDLFSTDFLPMHMRSKFQIYQKIGNEKTLLKRIDFSAFSIQQSNVTHIPNPKFIVDEQLDQKSKTKNDSYWQLFKDKLNGKF